MKASVEYLKEFRRVHCGTDMCKDCCFEDGGLCSIKRFIYKYGGSIPETQCKPEVDEEGEKKPEFNQEAAYKNYISVLSGIKAELREINNHLKVMERRR